MMETEGNDAPVLQVSMQVTGSMEINPSIKRQILFKNLYQLIPS